MFNPFTGLTLHSFLPVFTLHKIQIFLYILLYFLLLDVLETEM